MSFLGSVPFVLCFLPWVRRFHVAVEKGSVRLMFLSVGQVFSCRCGEGFRSPYVHCFSGNNSPANVLRAFSATPLTIPAPGRENRHFVVHSPYAVCLSGRGRACIPAGRPLRPLPCGRTRSAVNGSSIFTPDQRHRFNSLLYKQILFAVKNAKRGDGQVWMGPAENCRRVSGGPGEPAGMRVQGARSSVVGRISVAPSGMGC